MPKEVIHNDHIFEGDNSSPLAVEVMWGRNTFVQIGSFNMNEPEYEKTRGWYVDLDRALINRLIKALRRARDQAYGVDE
jgi:hypothetical protein